MNTRIMPNLIDRNILKKLTKIEGKKINKSIGGQLSSFIGRGFLKFIERYSDVILVLIILGVILYFRYRYTNSIKNKKKKNPNYIEVNYHRNIDMVDNEVQNITDNIEQKDELSENVLELVKKQINEYDTVNNFANLNDLNSYNTF